MLYLFMLECYVYKYIRVIVTKRAVFRGIISQAKLLSYYCKLRGKLTVYRPIRVMHSVLTDRSLAYILIKIVY